ncbi:MAG: XylR family transcriptional regulator [Opitutaceae bacterium]|jgi:LacI family transcriptional regulator|nr:XylR family transcriptional regulator [Opitutaceae bacterium]
MSNAKSPAGKQLPPRRAHVHLAFTQYFSFAEGIRHGILDYAKACGRWKISFMPESLGPSVAWLRHAKVDGAIAQVVSAAEKRIVNALPFPVVNLAALIDPKGMLSVMANQQKIGKLAACHLLERGFRRLAFYGTSNMWYSRQRLTGFSEAIRQAGAACKSHVVEATLRMNASWRDQHRQLEHWLRGLRPPVGIFASTDARAAMIVDACESIGLRIPEDVAVMGVDNDPSICQLSSVSLTSIARNDRKLGWTAAEVLDHAMAGHEMEDKLVSIEPEPVVMRKSTETLAIDDPVVAGLVAGLREHLGKPFGVEWLVSHSNRSRRWLEVHFRQALGQPPLAIINNLRVAKASEMLRSASNKHVALTDIAAQCGFTDLRHFRIVFSKHMGMTPKKFQTDAGVFRSTALKVP